MADPITERQRRILRHALGPVPLRCRINVVRGSAAEPDVMALVDMGLMEVREPAYRGRTFAVRVTAAGAAAVGAELPED